MEVPPATLSSAIAPKGDTTVNSEGQYQSGSRSTAVDGENVPVLEREKSWTEVQRKKKTGARNEGKVSNVLSSVPG